MRNMPSHDFLIIGTVDPQDYLTMPFPGGTGVHVYPVEAWNYVTVECKNNVSSGIVTKLVISIDPIVNIQLVKTGAIVGTQFYIEWTIDLGTNATWELYLEGVQYPVTYNEATKQGRTTNMMNALPVGRYVLELIGNNAVSINETLLTNFTVDRPITGLVVTKSKDWIELYESVTYTVTMTGGSSVVVDYLYQVSLPLVFFN